MARIDRPFLYFFLLVVCSNNVSILRHFFDTTTFRVYVTACRVPNLKRLAEWPIYYVHCTDG